MSPKMGSLLLGVWLFSMAALAQDNTEITFFLIGDWGAMFFSEQQAVADLMNEVAGRVRPSFIISTGDNFYQWGVESPEDEQFNTKWRGVYNGTNLRDLPWYITVGNHDYGFGEGEEWHQVTFGQTEPRWIFPHLWHSFTLQVGSVSVLLVLMDTEVFRTVGAGNDPDAMLAFIDNELARPARIKMLIGHREIYASGDKGPRSGRNWDNLQPLLERHGAQFYICGHDHNLQHLHSLNRTENKVDYILSGGGGNIPYMFDEEKVPILRDLYNMHLAKFIEDNGFVSVKIDQERTTFEYYNTSQPVYTYSRDHDPVSV